jgi:hypothetical protein
MKCIQCNNNQSPGAEPYCGSCWAKLPGGDSLDWPSYNETAVAMLATGNRCRHCKRQLYSLPGDDTSIDICVDCYRS